MSFLRELGIGIGFNVDSGPLKQADAATDQFKENIQEGTEYTEELGIKFEEVGGLAADVFERAGTSAEEMGVQIEAAMMDAEDSVVTAEGAVQDFGQQATRSGREADQAFGEVADTFEEVGSQASNAMNIIKGGIASIMATGFLGFLVRASSTLETAGFRAQWFADEVEGGFDALNEAIGKTVELSRGLHAKGELLEAANQAMQVGASVEFISDSMAAAAIISARTGNDIGKVMHQLGRAVEIGSIRQLTEMGVVTEAHFAQMGEEVTQSIRGWEKYRREMLLQIATQDTLTRHGERYNDYLETSGAQLGILRSELGNVAEVMGAPILGPMNRFVGYLSDILKWAQNDPIGEMTLKFLGWAAGIGTLAVGGLGLVKILGALKGILAPLIIPFLKFAAIAVGVVLVVDDLITAFFGLGDSVTETVFDAVMGFLGFDMTFQDFRDGLIAGLKALGEWFKWLGGEVWDVLQYMGATIVEAWTEYNGVIGLFRWGIESLVDLFEWLGGVVSDIVGWVIEKFNDMESGIGGVFRGIYDIATGILNTIVDTFLVTVTAIWGIFTGDFAPLKEAFSSLMESLGQIWDGFKEIVRVPVDWALDKVDSFVGGALGLLDRVVQGFTNLPGAIMEGIGDFGGMLKDKMLAPLRGLRDMLPFSPAKEGPLVDLHESGYNILGNISEGMEGFGRLDIGEQIELPVPEILSTADRNQPDIDRMTNTVAEILSTADRNQSDIDRMTNTVAGTTGTGVVGGGSSSVEQNPQFNTTLNIEYTGTASGGANDDLVSKIDRRLRQTYQDLMDEYFRTLSMKRTTLAER